MRKLLSEVIPECPILVAISARARELAVATRGATPAAAAWPTTVDEISDEWMEAEVARRRAVSDHESRLAVIADLERNARDEIYDLIETRATDLIAALAAQFDDLVDRLADAVAELGEDVNTAAAAIASGPLATAAWKAIADMADEYADIRAVQLRLYRGCTTIFFDELRCGDQDPAVTSTEARVYFHRHIAAIAPNWRGGRNDHGVILDATYPWPADPVERLVWFTRSDSGMWCPTPDELREHFTNSPATPLPHLIAQQVVG
ncbi:hypothetical protein [Mycobacterium sp. 1423905.2]|uniref:hypothetical protein n=1 Tax=Mycobacterium sp. 1423905.2 TaxID=1856859 RepID=UPI0015618322|nr:hypothetical protein [Mycobacterium sp. 1423905.2]